MTLRKAFALAVGITLAGSGTAFAGSAALSDSEMDRVSAQGIQTIVNESNFPVADQNNNLDSVQLNDFAQESSNVEGLINSAVSAVNASANLLYSGPATSSGIEQENDNTAKNHVNDSFAFNNDAYAQNLNKQTQDVNNSFLVTIEDQENNNNSVQMNDNAQQNSEGVSVLNSAFSANNFGLNIYSSDSGNIAGGDITQTNTQRAYNMNNTADAEDGAAYAQNYEEGVVTQRIENSFLDTTIEYQDNNNNSVQVNDDAQQNALVDSLVNTAKSATNTGANLATVGNVTGTDIYQTNTAVAENHVNDAFSVDGDAYAENQNKQTQHVHNGEFPVTAQLTTVIEDQENNNNSVQLNDNAQENVSAVLLENSASSAVNAGLNVLDVGDITNSDDTIYQKNVQTAENFDNYADGGTDAKARNWETSDDPGQYIANNYAIIYDQDNNNNSVQVNDNAQQYVTVDKLINSANSAVNVGQNLINWDNAGGDVTNSVIHQENTQTAKNHYNDAFALEGEATAKNKYKQTQVVENYFATDLSNGTQDNNMNSVQLNDNAQRYASAVVLINSAASAVNAGLNVINAGTLSQTCVKQFNTNTAVNYSNVADGGTFAYAVNKN
ncbi:MAG TPA: hypothetical protein DDW94_06490 [Deltaproteobacteria bacterium]|nr:MAG: hypothetical protein A2Z79_01020 [Deltaproteobacteria bacterium GWA2_55_82]OGQ64240.1 MAG: hypothetical protein A3I81_12905 [Deltaproteobacteria bacterium RIFCSPLOWO2_02_FULL_55_12]OIJ74019.1 MAG: hypothetical protein A2V21_306930 [Deltaproteobacteria bacterium GWC2_55_46]HBG46625.1 hypothetical protein [Deltaproteobacteria bacterium]HCY11367.1 hypothetical protein [Deltaproteobacteria bacterium]